MQRNFYFIFFLSILFSLLIQSPTAASGHSWVWDEATGTLTINTNSPSGQTLETTITACAFGFVVINGNIWPRKPDNSYIQPGEVKKIIINDGNGDDAIDLTYLTQTTFPLLVQGTEPNVEVNLSGGADFVHGSLLDDLMRFFAGGTIYDGSNKIIYGNAGDDQITSGPGNDQLFGDDGNDLLTGGGGNDILRGGNGDDQLQGTEGTNDLFGGDGNDVLDGGTNNDFLYGENGDDILRGGIGDDLLEGGTGADELRGDNGNDELQGDAGDDLLYGGDGNDVLRGNDDNDFLYGENGDDIIEGGPGNDQLFGSSDNDRLDGGEGDDVLSGDAGDDFLVGLSGADQLIGGDGDDKIVDFVNDDSTIDTGPGADATFLSSLAGPDIPLHKVNFQSTITITDISGNDTLSFDGVDAGIIINLDLQNTEQVINAAGDVLTLNGVIENFFGSAFDDIINIAPDASAVRNVDGGAHTNGDVLNVDALNNDCTDDGSCVVTEGLANITYSNVETVNLLNVTDAEEELDMPITFALYQNYPNPFNPTTIISYDLPQTCDVILRIYDTLGNEVKIITNYQQSAGRYHYEFNAEGLASGIYIYKITAGNFIRSGKMMLLK